MHVLTHNVVRRDVHVSITPELVKWKTVDKWDGRLPQVTSDRASPFVSIDQGIAKAK